MLKRFALCRNEAVQTCCAAEQLTCLGPILSAPRIK